MPLVPTFVQAPRGRMCAWACQLFHVCVLALAVSVPVLGRLVLPGCCAALVVLTLLRFGEPPTPGDEEQLDEVQLDNVPTKSLHVTARDNSTTLHVKVQVVHARVCRADVAEGLTRSAHLPDTGTG